MATLSAVSNTVRNGVAAARRLLKVTLAESPVVRDSHDDDGLHRVELATGDIVEVTCRKGRRGPTVVDIVSEK